jgi:hypothetical protein
VARLSAADDRRKAGVEQIKGASTESATPGWPVRLASRAGRLAKAGTGVNSATQSLKVFFVNILQQRPLLFFLVRQLFQGHSTRHIPRD